jgi:hypothetical protein
LRTPATGAEQALLCGEQCRGELSRVMLVLKSVLGDKGSAPTPNGGSHAL